jgi:hypothetical protein
MLATTNKPASANRRWCGTQTDEDVRHGADEEPQLLFILRGGVRSPRFATYLELSAKPARLADKHRHLALRALVILVMMVPPPLAEKVTGTLTAGLASVVQRHDEAR